jgi:hypothetical protein
LQKIYIFPKKMGIVSFNRSKILKIIFSGYADSGENLKISAFIASPKHRCFNTYNRLRD